MYSATVHITNKFNARRRYRCRPILLSSASGRIRNILYFCLLRLASCFVAHCCCSSVQTLAQLLLSLPLLWLTNQHKSSKLILTIRPTVENWNISFGVDQFWRYKKHVLPYNQVHQWVCEYCKVCQHLSIAVFPITSRVQSHQATLPWK